MLRILIALSFLVSVLAPTPSSAQAVIADAGEDLILECSAAGGTTATLDGLGCVADNGAIQVDGRVCERLRSIRRALEDERRRRAMEESE